MNPESRKELRRLAEKVKVSDDCNMTTDPCTNCGSCDDVIRGEDVLSLLDSLDAKDAEIAHLRWRNDQQEKIHECSIKDLNVKITESEARTERVHTAFREKLKDAVIAAVKAADWHEHINGGYVITDKHAERIFKALKEIP